MKLEDAYKILDVTKDTPKDEVKKQFKKLAAKYHPDVNKETDANNKFKEINSAYELICNPPINHMPDISSGMVRVHRSISFGVLNITTTLSFKEAVLGCKKMITSAKMVMCSQCHGETGFTNHEKCSVCNGRGARVHGNSIFTVMEPCHACGGSGQNFEPCAKCQGHGAIQEEKTMEVNFQGGITTGQVIRLRGGGHFQSEWGRQSFGDAFITVRVEPDKNMKISGLNVISEIEVTLLEALEGCKKKVMSVHGEVDLTIPPKTKNLDEVRLNKYGAVTSKITGDHLFKIKVNYPNDVSKIIKILKD